MREVIDVMTKLHYILDHEPVDNIWSFFMISVSFSHSDDVLRLSGRLEDLTETMTMLQYLISGFRKKIYGSRSATFPFATLIEEVEMW